MEEGGAAGFAVSSTDGFSLSSHSSLGLMQGRCQENEIFFREHTDVLVYGGEGNANSMQV